MWHESVLVLVASTAVIADSSYSRADMPQSSRPHLLPPESSFNPQGPCDCILRVLWKLIIITKHGLPRSICTRCHTALKSCGIFPRRVRWPRYYIIISAIYYRYTCVVWFTICGCNQMTMVTCHTSREIIALDEQFRRALNSISRSRRRYSTQ